MSKSEEHKSYFEYLYFQPGDRPTGDESIVFLAPGKITLVSYDQDLILGSPAWWGMVLRAGFVQYQWKQGPQFTNTFVVLKEVRPPTTI